MDKIQTSFAEIEKVFKSQAANFQQSLAQKDDNIKKFIEIQTAKEVEIAALKEEISKILQINITLQKRLSMQENTIKQLDDFKRSMHNLIQSTPLMNESTTTITDSSDKDLRFLETSQKLSNSTLHSQENLQHQVPNRSLQPKFSQSIGSNPVNSMQQQILSHSLGSARVQNNESLRSTPKRINNDLVPQALSIYNASPEINVDDGYGQTEQSFIQDTSLPVFDNSQMEFSCSSMDPSGLLTIELLEPPLKQEQIDPALLYKMIRQCISAEEFEQFAAVIGNFNRGSDPQKTIEDVKRLVPDEKLVEQMTTLVLNAAG